MSRRDLARLSCHLGPTGAILAWLVIAVAWALNRGWFAYTRHAFSDLGGEGACCPWVYNIGLIVVGVVLLVFGSCVAWLATTKLGVVGGSYLALAGVFLALIGVFPAGTRPHTFVSTWFFIQADLGLVFSLTEAARAGCTGSRASQAAVLAAFPVAGLVDVLVGWPSAAVLETYGIITIDLGIITLWCCLTGKCGPGTSGRGRHP